MPATHHAPWLGKKQDPQEERESHFRHKQGSWGMPPHPSAWPCKMLKWRLAHQAAVLGAAERCTNMKGSPLALPKAPAGSEHSRSVSMSMSTIS